MKLEFCVVCGCVEVEHHHFIPKSLGGSDHESNLITLCYKHHGVIHGMERVNVGKLSRLALNKKKERGERVGSVPFGYKLLPNGVNLTSCEKERGAANFAKTLREEGLTLREISKKLASSGFLNRLGRNYAAKSVNSLIKSRSI